jgi:hypothetical protein
MAWIRVMRMGETLRQRRGRRKIADGVAPPPVSRRSVVR